MRSLRLAVFIIAFSVMSAELMRHSYIRWVENHTSVLDKYDPIDRQIKEASSLATLEKLYAEALERAKAENRVGPNQFDPDTSRLRQAIVEWEHRSNEVREVRYYWIVGLGCLLLALLLHWRRSPWISITLQIVGFSEMSWWLTPSFSNITSESGRVLDNKILFSGLSLLLILTFWRIGLLNPDERRSLN